jgi:uncharacterized protein
VTKAAQRVTHGVRTSASEPVVLLSALRKRAQRVKQYDGFRRRLRRAAGEAMLSLGYAYFHGEGVRRDRALGIKWYRAAARKGEASAMYNLGHIYRRGEGVPARWSRAINWYEKAAAKDHVGAISWLTSIFDGFEGLPEDAHRAVRWLKRAARLGDSEAQCILGVHYHEGDGVRKKERAARSGLLLSRGVRWRAIARRLHGL